MQHATQAAAANPRISRRLTTSPTRRPSAGQCRRLCLLEARGGVVVGDRHDREAGAIGVAGPGSAGRFDQPDALVVAQRRHAEPAALGDLTNRVGAHSLSVKVRLGLKVKGIETSRSVTVVRAAISGEDPPEVLSSCNVATKPLAPSAATPTTRRWPKVSWVRRPRHDGQAFASSVDRVRPPRSRCRRLAARLSDGAAAASAPSFRRPAGRSSPSL